MFFSWIFLSISGLNHVWRYTFKLTCFNIGSILATFFSFSSSSAAQLAPLWMFYYIATEAGADENK